MPFSPQTLEEKPYNMCVKCTHIGKRCDGPNFLAMNMPRLCEWSRLRKDYLHNLDTRWTNAYIAEQASVSKVSIDRFLSGNVDDIKISTIARIIKVLVNGSWGQYPCAMTADNPEPIYVDNPTLVERCERLQADLAATRADDRQKIDFLKDQIKFQEEQMTGKDKLLAERYGFIKKKDRAIITLSILLGIAVVIILALLIADLVSPDYGFFLRSTLDTYK